MTEFRSAMVCGGYFCVKENHRNNLQASNCAKECHLNWAEAREVKDKSYNLSKNLTVKKLRRIFYFLHTNFESRLDPAHVDNECIKNMKVGIK